MTAATDDIAATVRRHDPDRFLTALFAPAPRRDTLMVLYAFNHELARAREVASDPTLALMRLHWWREVVEGAPRHHEIATPLRRMIQAGSLDPAYLLPLIEARDLEAYGDFFGDAEWRDWVLAGPGGLAVAAAAALGAPNPEVARPYGAAYGVAGLLRASGALAARRRCLLPAALLARHGLVPEGFIEEPDGVAAQRALREVAEIGLSFLRAAPAVPRAAVAAVLPAVLGRRDLRRWPKPPGPRRLGDRLAVTWAGLHGRL
ncbi:squalene/phytoene synthase family protein [Rhodopila sp.]|uniref:squalene/phytoene synthase family protein n=1 Tax=Rhodopila sp. TaxID=2480087 RepID=UPI002C2C45AC|nr:squalene/phytoene synthase family protein [Rhodopila sp.]HVZ08363.1 squalene/phytoene synthase family protein [Rhodopila sp.]